MKRKFRKIKFSWKMFVVYITVGLIMIFFLFPIVWVALNSFKSSAQIVKMPPLLVFSPTLSQYQELFEKTIFPRNFLNSLLIATTASLISVVIGTFGAYGLARFNFKAKKNVTFWILSTRMAPPFAFLLPYYMLMRDLHLLDTRFSLILSYQVFNLAFVTWMMKGFFHEVPKEIDESARIDGCSPIGSFFKVNLPLVLPGLIATFIFSFIMSWNEFLFAYVMVSEEAQTIPPAIATYVGYGGIEWGKMATAGIIAAVPMFLFSLMIQKHIVRGLTAGAVKR